MKPFTRRGFALSMMAAGGSTLAACGNGIGSNGGAKIDARVDQTINYLYSRYPATAELAEKGAELSVEQAEFDLSQKVIRAPIGGWVGLLDIEVGDRITNQDILATLTDRSRILVDFRVSERLTSQVRPGP